MAIRCKECGAVMSNKKNVITKDVWVCTNCYHKALFKGHNKQFVEKDVFV